MPSMYGLRVRDTEFKPKVRDGLNRFVKGYGAVRRANQRAVTELANAAARNLAQRARRRMPDTRNQPGLAQVLTDPSLNKVTMDGFEFLIDSRLKSASERAWRYYRVIEGGPGSEVARYYWVTRTGFHHNQFRLLFFGPGGFGHQQARGSWTNPRFPVVRITHPVPAYHYIEDAITDFRRNDRYREIVLEELGRVGVTPRARGGRGAAGSSAAPPP